MASAKFVAVRKVRFMDETTAHDNDPTGMADDDGALEGPDVETPTGDRAGADGEVKPGGLGQDGTIPNDPSGIAAGHTGEPSTFEPEEDEAAPV